LPYPSYLSYLFPGSVSAPEPISLCRNLIGFRNDRKKEPEPVKVTAGDKAVTAALVALLLVLLLDDVVGGEADDAAIPGVVEELARRLGPGLRAVLTVP